MTDDTSDFEANSRPDSSTLRGPVNKPVDQQSDSRRWRKISISGSMIFEQVRHDLFGSKDAQDASTLTYTWVADQFGHVTLGFIVTLLLSVVTPVISSAFVVAIAIALKEAWDYYCELRRHQGAFPFDRKDVLLNCATSCIYTWIGVVLAVVAVSIPRWSIFSAVAMVVVSLPIATYWLRRKIALQQSDVPFLYRLTNFPENFVATDGPCIISSLVGHTAPQFRHVILTGPLDSGKTSLAVAAATEYGYRVGMCRFISLVKLAQTGFSSGHGMTERRGLHEGTTFQDGRTIWPLDAVELLIVDDADGGVPQLEIKEPDIRAALIGRLGQEFFSRMRERRTLWVAGTNDCAERWQRLVAELLTDGDVNHVGKVALRADLQSALRSGHRTTLVSPLRRGRAAITRAQIGVLRPHPMKRRSL